MYSENLKKLRKELKLSVSKLGELLDMPQRTLSAYERKERTPSIDLVTRLCTKLNINANWFVTGKGEMFASCDEKTELSDLTSKVKEILKNEGLIK